MLDHLILNELAGQIIMTDEYLDKDTVDLICDDPAMPPHLHGNLTKEVKYFFISLFLSEILSSLWKPMYCHTKFFKLLFKILILYLLTGTPDFKLWSVFDSRFCFRFLPGLRYFGFLDLDKLIFVYFYRFIEDAFLVVNSLNRLNNKDKNKNMDLNKDMDIHTNIKKDMNMDIHININLDMNKNIGMDIHINKDTNKNIGRDIHINKDMNKNIGRDIHINKGMNKNMDMNILSNIKKDMNKNMDMNILSNIKKDMKKNILDIKDINVGDEGLEDDIDRTAEHIDLEDAIEEDVNEKIRKEFFPLFPYFLHNIEC